MVRYDTMTMHAYRDASMVHATFFLEFFFFGMKILYEMQHALGFSSLKIWGAYTRSMT